MLTMSKKRGPQQRLVAHAAASAALVCYACLSSLSSPSSLLPLFLVRAGAEVPQQAFRPAVPPPPPPAAAESAAAAAAGPAAFVPSPQRRRATATTRRTRCTTIPQRGRSHDGRTFSSTIPLQMAGLDEPPIRRVTLPLLDVSPSSSSSSLTSKTVIVPLPSSHLPDDISTLNVYGFRVEAPVHRMLIEHSLRGAGTVQDEAGNMPGVKGGAYGHLVMRGSEDEGLVGGVGCAVDVVLAAPKTGAADDSAVGGGPSPGGEGGMTVDWDGESLRASGGGGGGDDGPSSASSSSAAAAASDGGGGGGGSGPMAVMVRGSFRFVVREVLKTIPYPVVVVDELRDEDEPASSAAGAVEQPVSKASDDGDLRDEDEDDDDDDDGDYDMYSDLTPRELVQRTLSAMQAIVDQRLREATDSKPPSPLEQSILEDAGMDVPGAAEAKRSHAEEMAAVLDVFRTELIDICPRPADVRFAVGMMAAEMADLDNDVRAECLTLTDGTERLRLVLKALEDKIGMAQAKRLTAQITEEADGDQRDLKVGTPQLPPWASQIRKGTRVQYYWNEAEGWCDGVVAEDPVKILDELVIPVTFDDDGSTHRLPFRAEEKVRWRPGDMKN